MSDENPSEYLDKARESFKYGRFAEAAEWASRATNAAPDDAETFALLGVSLSRLNQHTQAESALMQAIRLAPDLAKHRYNLAAHHYAVGNREGAKAAAELALQLEPAHGPANDLLARIAHEAAPFQQEAQYGGPAPTPFAAYTPPTLARPVHTIRFIESLGWAWDVLGWFLFAALVVTKLVVDSRLVPYLQGAGDNFEQSLTLVQKMVTEHYSLVVGLMVWFGLMATWWILDMADRRPPSGLVTMGVIGLVSFFCCPYFAWVLFPVYFFLRLQASRTAGR